MKGLNHNDINTSIRAEQYLNDVWQHPKTLKPKEKQTNQHKLRERGSTPTVPYRSLTQDIDQRHQNYKKTIQYK